MNFSAQGKIRLMLALLCASLLFTAIVVEKTYTPAINLSQTAKSLSQNLHEKERDVNNIIYNSKKFAELKKLSTDPKLAMDYIQHFTADRNTWFITLDKGKLSFWSGVKIIPDSPASIKDGYSFITGPNGYYEAIKKSDGAFSVIFFIPVKLEYAFENQFLQNTFATDLLKDNNLELADYTDKNVAVIRSISDAYLFSVKLKPGEINLTYLYYEFAVWMATLLSLCILITSICNYISDKGYVLSSVLLMCVCLLVIRFVNFYYHWPDFTAKFELFKPALYHDGFANPSFGDFCINILLFAWLAVYLYIHRKKIIRKIPGKVRSYFVYTFGVLLLIAVATVLQNLFFSLVVSSKINFDVSNILNLSWFSALGVLMLSFGFLIFFLLSEVFLTTVARLPIPDRHKLVIFVSLIVLATIFYTWHYAFTLFYILWGALVVMRARAYLKAGGALDATSMALIILVCSFISSMRLNYYQSVKERNGSKLFMRKLEVPDDTAADHIFKRIEKLIVADTSINNHFNDNIKTGDYIKDRLQKLYFSGYLSRYDINAYVFGSHEQALSADKTFDLNDFKDEILYKSYTKASDRFFYRENQTFGFLKYLAIVPIEQYGEKKGTVVIQLVTKPQQTTASLPGLLVDNESLDENNNRGEYSYAFYEDNRLINQSGSYSYDIENKIFNSPVGHYSFKTTNYDGPVLFKRFNTFRHLIYKASGRTLIVVTKEDSPLYFIVTSTTFFFVFFMVFSVTAVLVRWLWLRIKILTIKNDRLSWNFKISLDLVLYKTRIQFSMVFAVVFTLVLVGFISFFSISAEYESQQNKDIRDKINKIAAVINNTQYVRTFTAGGEEAQVAFDNFADNYSTDLILFDPNGLALLTTQPKVYDFGLQSRRMNARAFITLAREKKSEFVNSEKIGLLNYKAAFVPIVDNNNDNQLVAYLELPYFSDETDYREHIGSLLNIMLNVYAIVFMAIGLFAIFIARQITSPLSFIQDSLSKTVYGKKNEPIVWDRDDEIGALVKEYNKMIAQLETSARRLAQSEREHAWREMAKQVAHEIKNPLTPLKLGLQLLDKSWRDKDPKFDQKFERFSKSFVEQIESLSSIASEFSAFAKMPETKMVQMNVFDAVAQAVTIFKEMDNIKIVYEAPQSPFMVTADRDQLLRCFNNLLKNAIEATANRPGVIEIDYVLTAKNVLVTIKDNGEGIPEGLREKIFEPNFTTKSSGTGLGLAFVKNSIENAGGKVWFQTALGQGTTFYISLPAAEAGA